MSASTSRRRPTGTGANERAAVLAARLASRSGRLGRLAGPDLEMLCSFGPRRWGRQRRLARTVAIARDLGDEPVYRPIWEHAAEALDAEVEDLGAGYLRISTNGAATVVWRNLVQLDDPVTLRIAGDKPVVHRLLRSAGLPVAEHVTFDRRRPDEALSFLGRMAAPCVVKPAFGTGAGTGITCGVRSPEDLVRASVRAGRWDDRVLIERQASGSEYRVLVLDGQALDIIHRRHPRVTGDGVSTIEVLIGAENRSRMRAKGLAGLWPISIDLDCQLTLRSVGLSLGSIPQRGIDVAVKGGANQNGPRDNETVNGTVGTTLEADAVAALHAIGARFGSVEVVTPDASRSLGDAGGVVIEINTTPGFHYHYQVANRDRAVPVAVPLLRTLLGAAAVRP